MIGTGFFPQGLAGDELLLGAGQFVFGAVFVVVGLRIRPFRHPDGRPIDFRPRTFVPAGLIFVVQGAVQLAKGFAPVVPMFTVEGLAFVAIGVWWFRLHRAQRRELFRIAAERAKPSLPDSPVNPSDDPRAWPRA